MIVTEFIDSGKPFGSSLQALLKSGEIIPWDTKKEDNQRYHHWHDSFTR